MLHRYPTALAGQILLQEEEEKGQGTRLQWGHETPESLSLVSAVQTEAQIAEREHLRDSFLAPGNSTALSTSLFQSRKL